MSIEGVEAEMEALTLGLPKTIGGKNVIVGDNNKEEQNNPGLSHKNDYKKERNHEQHHSHQ